MLNIICPHCGAAVMAADGQMPATAAVKPAYARRHIRSPIYCADSGCYVRVAKFGDLCIVHKPMSGAPTPVVPLRRCRFPTCDRAAQSDDDYCNDCRNWLDARDDAAAVDARFAALHP